MYTKPVMSKRRTWIPVAFAALMLSTTACKKEQSTTPPDDAGPDGANEGDLDAPDESDLDDEDDVDDEPETAILTKASFEEAIMDHFDDVSDCYMTALEGNPDLAGTMKVAFTIDAEGKVAGIEIEDGSTLTDEGLVACLEARVDGWQFDKPSHGETVMDYPFNLEPAE